MKKLFFVALFSLCSVLLYSSENHPIKLTSSLIKYNAENKTIGVECKVFIDDFASHISATLPKSINESTLTKDDIRRIENYFTAKFKINIKGKTLPWVIKSYDISLRENILTLVFSSDTVTLNKGDDITIENNLLFEIFDDLQSNWMTLRFPPFFNNDNFESNTFHNVYSKNF